MIRAENAWQPGTLPPQVRIRGLNHCYGSGELTKQVLFDNQLTLYPGEIVIMTGPSGSGKTTLLTLIGALRSVQRGSLEVLDQQLAEMTSMELVQLRRQIGFIFQAHNLFGSLTAVQNVRMAVELQGLDTREMQSRAIEMLERLGLGARVHYKPAQLSGGQRQRVAIARALVSRPKLILADEPTAALDKQSGRDVVNLLQEFAKQEQSTILLVTHDNRILDVADRIVNMVDGRIISDVVVGESVEKCEFLRGCAPFAEMTPATLSDVADKMLLEKISSGQIIVRQGDEGDKFYIIREGQVRVNIRDAAGERQVATLKSGDSFGEAALLTGAPRNATVTAEGDVQVYSLGKEDFQAALEKSATFHEQIRSLLFTRQ